LDIYDFLTPCLLRSGNLSSSTAGRILIVDDDPTIRRVLRATLPQLGFSTGEACSGEDAAEAMKSGTFDAILLDVNMPGMGGMAACKELREHHPNVGILMLTVIDSEENKIAALDAGADDYIVKPFHLRELAARLRAILRRARELPSISKPAVIRVGGLELDHEKRLLTKAGEAIRLTPKEFELLEYLMSHPGIPIPHARLLRAVWGPEYGNELEYLRTFVRQLRKKIEDDAAAPTYLMTDPHVGYRFRDLDDD